MRIVLILGALMCLNFAASSQNSENGTAGLEDVEQLDLISSAPTERLKTYLESFPEDFVVTRDWYELNKVSFPINVFTEEETLHFAKYVKRFTTLKYK
jgi:hypothetical protein